MRIGSEEGDVIPPRLPPVPSRRHGDQILQALQQRTLPATAQELHAELRAGGHGAGLATIYRALHALQQVGRVHAIRRPDDVAYRSCGSSPHDHLVCEVCGVVIEVPRTALQRWVTGEAALAGVRLSAGPQQLLVVCTHCHRDSSGGVRSGATGFPPLDPC